MLSTCRFSSSSKRNTRHLYTIGRPAFESELSGVPKATTETVYAHKLGVGCRERGGTNQSRTLRFELRYLCGDVHGLPAERRDLLFDSF